MAGIKDNLVERMNWLLEVAFYGKGEYNYSHFLDTSSKDPRIFFNGINNNIFTGYVDSEVGEIILRTSPSSTAYFINKEGGVYQNYIPQPQKNITP